MKIVLRRGRREDAEACDRVCFEAFRAIARAHNFTPDFPSADVAIELMPRLLDHSSFYPVVAEHDGRIIGSNFLDKRNPIAGVGPLTVDPAFQDKAVGGRLMADVHQHARENGFDGVRLLQAAYHNRSLSLYAKLGYDVREPLACMQGSPFEFAQGGSTVRPATESDIEACNQLCRTIHGYHRDGELRDAVTQGAATVVERDGRVTGYATTIGFFGHAVGEQNDDLQALIGAATSFVGPGFLLPTRNTDLLRWCLHQGLRVTQPLTLMSRGAYNDPSGAFLPSIFY